MTKKEFKEKITIIKEQLKNRKAEIASFLDKKRSLSRVSFIMSLFTLIAYHNPFFSYITENVGKDLSGTWIVISMVIIMLALNFLVYFLLMYIFRIVGKYIIALTLTGNAVCLYFINTYNVLIDRSMMRNVFETEFSEASSFFSWTIILYSIILGIIPAVLLIRQKLNYGSFGKFLLKLVICLVVIVGTLAGNYKNIFWIDRHAPVIGSKLMPWSYTINTIRYFEQLRKENQKEIILPDAEYLNDNNDIVVLIIGESARSQNFSLYGYDRNTNPFMQADGVTAIRARASHTNTIDAVKSILQHRPITDDLYEILPNYLYRYGVDVIWRRSNWGTPPLHIEKQYTKDDLKAMYPDVDNSYDGILFHGLQDHIMANDSSKIFIGIHTYTSHGPEYYSNTPEAFKTFKPECRTVEMAQAKYSELINAYDNTVIYTDYLVHSVIETLKQFPDRRSCVIFISDHGESLGENGLYMHGVPLSMAPEEQLDIPFIVWTSDNSDVKVKSTNSAGHGHIFHSVLKFLGLQTSFYDESKNIFE